VVGKEKERLSRCVRGSASLSTSWCSTCGLTGEGGCDLIDTLYKDVETLFHTLALHPLHVFHQHVELQ